MLMCNMRLQTLRQVGLNLFVTFPVIAEAVGPVDTSITNRSLSGNISCGQ
jgi:hypothetical protein